MGIVDKKLTSVYKLCKFISEVQQTEKKSLEKLAALDELSDSFWNVSYLIYFGIYLDFILIFKILIMIIFVACLQRNNQAITSVSSISNNY